MTRKGRSTLTGSICWRERTKKMLEDCDQKGEIHTDRIKMLEDGDQKGEIHTGDQDVGERGPRRCLRTVTWE